MRKLSLILLLFVVAATVFGQTAPSERRTRQMHRATAIASNSLKVMEISIQIEYGAYLEIGTL